MVLQHGALPLYGDVGRLAEALALSPSERAELRATLRSRAITLEEAVGHTVDREQVVAALTEGFGRALNLRLEPGELSAEEQATALLLQARYADEAMTGRPQRAEACTRV